MEQKLGQRIKAILMTIGKKIATYVLLVLILINVTNCTMEPEFKVYGDPEILQDIKINLEILRQAKYPIYESTIVTLYDKGRKYSPQIEYSLNYDVYVSYKNTYVNVFGVENIDQWAHDFIHHLYIYKENDSIYINHVGRKSEIDEFKYHKGTSVIPLNDFYEKENITSDKQKEVIKNKFFEFYDPMVIEYSKLEQK